jgi:hypothetical protein
VRLPAGVDLIVISPGMPLELAGRIAQDGVVLFEDDREARVEWVATTRKIWRDDRYRFAIECVVDVAHHFSSSEASGPRSAPG